MYISSVAPAFTAVVATGCSRRLEGRATEKPGMDVTQVAYWASVEKSGVVYVPNHGLKDLQLPYYPVPVWALRRRLSYSGGTIVSTR